MPKGLENKSRGGTIATDISRKGINFKISFRILYPSFSLTLIVKLEIDSSGGKILISGCNEMTLKKKKKVNCIFKGKIFSSVIMAILKVSCQA